MAIWATRQTDSARACGHAQGVSAIVHLHEQLLPSAKIVELSQEQQIENYLDNLRP